jgi:hypothetical protein
MSDETKVVVSHLFLYIASDYEPMDGGFDPGDRTYFCELSSQFVVSPEEFQSLRITAEDERLRVHLEGDPRELTFIDCKLTRYWRNYTTYRFISYLGAPHKMT